MRERNAHKFFARLHLLGRRPAWILRRPKMQQQASAARTHDRRQPLPAIGARSSTQPSGRPEDRQVAARFATTATSEAQQLIGQLQEELGQAEAGKARRDEVARLHGEVERLHGILKHKDEQLAKKDETYREDMIKLRQEKDEQLAKKDEKLAKKDETYREDMIKLRQEKDETYREDIITVRT